MIIANGTLEFIVKSGGGIDATTGHPIPPTVSYGSPIPCQYQASFFNFQGRNGTEAVTKASYSILIEDKWAIGGESVRVKDIHGNTIGEFSVKQIKPLHAVCQYLIIT